MILSERENIAIHGYHNKEENSYSIMDGNLPLLVNEKFTPFLITKGYHYTINTKEVVDLIQNYDRVEKFRKNKRIIANILIVPGLLFALMYIAQAIGVLSTIPILYTLSQSWVADFAFWLAMLGVIILWHEYFRHRTHPVKLPKTERFTDREINTIKIMGIKFGLYKRVTAQQFLSEESKELLHMSSTFRKKSQQINTFELFTTLLELDEIQELLKRADIKIYKKDFDELKINRDTFPKFPIESLRSLIVYSLEEAVITESTNVQPLHIFIGMIRVYPALRKILREQGSNIEIIREAANYILQTEPKRSALSPFNINNTYYKTGGVGHAWIYRFPEKSKQYIKDVTIEVSHEHERYGIAQAESVNELIDVLERTDNNKALIIGSTGVGKSSIIKALAQQITWGEAPEALLDFRVVKIGSDFIVNNTPKISPKYLAQLLKSVEADRKTIFYIDDLLQILLPLPNRKTLNETQSLLQQFVLKSPSPIVSTMHYHDYQRYLKESNEMWDRFTNIEVPIVSQTDTLAVLKEKIDNIERTYNVYVTIPALINIVELSTQKESPYKLPKVSVDLLVRIIKDAKAKGIRIIKSENVGEFGPKLFTEHREEQPINTLIPREKSEPETQLLSPSEAADKMVLQNRIKEQIIGRDITLESILQTLHLRDQQKQHTSLGKFMMVGPSGTGKTHMSRVIAKEYFGSHKNFLHLDLSELKYSADIKKVLMRVSLPLGNTRHLQFRGVILLDNLEELNEETWPLIHDLLTKGVVQGQYRKDIDLKDCLIIATSKIGEEEILKTTTEDDEALIEDSKRMATLMIRQHLSPDLLDTFDEIFIFSPYRIDELSRIAEKELERISVIFLKNGFNLKWDPGVPQVLANSLKRGDMELIDLRKRINELSQYALESYTEDEDDEEDKEIKINVNMVGSP